MRSWGGEQVESCQNYVHIRSKLSCWICCSQRNIRSNIRRRQRRRSTRKSGEMEEYILWMTIYIVFVGRSSRRIIQWLIVRIVRIGSILIVWDYRYPMKRQRDPWNIIVSIVLMNWIGISRNHWRNTINMHSLIPTSNCRGVLVSKSISWLWGPEN